MITSITPPHRPEDFYQPEDGEDDSPAVQRCLIDAIRVARENGGHDVELSQMYTLASLRSTVIPPDVKLRIYGRTRGAGFRSTLPTYPFYLTGPTHGGTRVEVTNAVPAKARSILVADATGITSTDLIEIRQTVPPGGLARWQQARVLEVIGTSLILDRPLDFPLDPAIGECTVWPYGVAADLIMDTVTFDGAIAIVQRLRDSCFNSINGTVRFQYGYKNRFSGIVGQPSFGFQSALVIVDATARERYLDFDGCSGMHAMLLRSEIIYTAQQRSVKFAGCSYLRIERAEIFGSDYTGFSVTEGCYDIVAERVDASGCRWAVWTNGRSNEGTVIRAFSGLGNPYDLVAADVVYFRRESGDGQLSYPPGSDVA